MIDLIRDTVVVHAGVQPLKCVGMDVMTVFCKLCFKNFSSHDHPDLQLHHVSYFPELIIDLCRICHGLVSDSLLRSTFKKYTSSEYYRFYGIKFKDVRNCLHCSAEYRVYRKDQKYCSGSCRSAACQMRQRFSRALMLQSPYNLGQTN